MILLKRRKAQITHLYTQIYNHETYYLASRMDNSGIDKPSLGQARHSSLGHLTDEQQVLAVAFLVLLVKKTWIKQSYVLKRRRFLVQGLVDQLPDQVVIKDWSLGRKIWSYMLIRFCQLKWCHKANEFSLNAKDKDLYQNVLTSPAITKAIDRTLLAGINPFSLGQDKLIDLIALFSVKFLNNQNYASNLTKVTNG